MNTPKASVGRTLCFASPLTVAVCAVVVCAIIALPSCHRVLVPTPSIYASGEENPFTDVPEHFQTNTVDVLYLADRLSEIDKHGELRYTHGRSRSLRYGSCVVEIGQDDSWNRLVEQSLSSRRSGTVRLRVQKTTELGQMTPTPFPLVELDGEFVENPELLAERDRFVSVFRDELGRRLALTDQKDAYIFIHGYHTSFNQAAMVMAELWHFLGRRGVPMIYSWPAGHPGLLVGYTYDRESGEFTLFHLKSFLRIFATLPELERVHIIAHSRGTDVITSALRELFIEIRAQGQDPREVLKIENVILAAPDLDLQVVSQRISAERFSLAVRELTIYVSNYDKAIGAADWLFASLRRLGQMRLGDLDPDQLEALADFRSISIIDVKYRPQGNTHSYFREDPGVFSDLIRLLRDSEAPGSPARPLRSQFPNFWSLEKGYPYIQNDPEPEP